MSSTPKAEHLTEARDAALVGIRCLQWACIDVVQAWVVYQRNRGGADPAEALAELEAELKRVFVKLVADRDRLRRALSPDLLTAIDIASAAAGDGQAVMVHKTCCSTHHEAAQRAITSFAGILIDAAADGVLMPDWVESAVFGRESPNAMPSDARTAYYERVFKLARNHPLIDFERFAQGVRREASVAIARRASRKGNAGTTGPTARQRKRDERRIKVAELHSKGLNGKEISIQLHVNESTISRDLRAIQG